VLSEYWYSKKKLIYYLGVEGAIQKTTDIELGVVTSKGELRHLSRFMIQGAMYGLE
jgi:hypothetical protein